MTPADRLRNEIGRIVSRYRELLESSASPLTATPSRWRQCQGQAEAILAECAGQLDGHARTMSAALQRTVELGARRAAERVPSTESVRAGLLLWQAAVPVFQEALSLTPCDRTATAAPLVVALDTLAEAIIGRLLHEAIGYNDPGIIREILADPDQEAQQRARSHDTLGAGLTAQLTIREHQVLSSAAKAMTNYEIGRELGIAETTVKRHLRNIFGKLGATSRMDAIAKSGMSVQLHQNPHHAATDFQPRSGTRAS